MYAIYIYMVTFTIHIPQMLAYIGTIHGSYGYDILEKQVYLKPVHQKDICCRPPVVFETGSAIRRFPSAIPPRPWPFLSALSVIFDCQDEHSTWGNL